jgi:cell division protein ZapA
MGEIVVNVNGRPFQLSCDDGQESRIRQLAQYVDSKVGELMRNAGQAGEARLLLMAAIVIADELSDAHEAAARRSVTPRVAPTPAVGPAVSGIHSIAARIESIAARFETS